MIDLLISSGLHQSQVVICVEIVVLQLDGKHEIDYLLNPAPEKRLRPQSLATALSSFGFPLMLRRCA